MADLVVDTSALIAVVMNAPEKRDIVEATRDASLIAPRSVHWEVGNAFSAMLRRRRIEVAQAIKALEIYGSIPIRFIEVALPASIMLADEHRLYAYDAYLIMCSLAVNAPLLTLDRSLARAARAAGVSTMEMR